MNRQTKAPIKVAHFITTISKGGATENTLLSAAGCQEMEHYEVSVIAGPPIKSEGDLLGLAKSLGVEVRIIPSLHKPIHLINDLRALAALISELIRGGYDVVHTHGSKAGVLGRLAAVLVGVKAVVHTIHGLPLYPDMPPLSKAFYLGVERMAARVTHEMLSVTHQLRLDALSGRVGRASRFSVVRSGMDLEPFLSGSDRRTAARQSLGLKSNQVAIGSIGRVCAQKGQDVILDVASDVIDLAPDSRFLFIGSGDLLEPLIKETSELELSQFVQWTGSVEPEEIHYYLSALDILVHVSEREGLARVIPQALASGKPVISYDLDGSPEVITDRFNGRLIPPFDRQELTDALVELVRDRGLREEMGARGPEVVDPAFRTEAMVQGVLLGMLRRNMVFLDRH